MWNDPIDAEVRRIRTEHAARFHFDLQAIYRDLKEKEKNSGRTYIRYPPRTCVRVAQAPGRVTSHP